MRISDWSSDVCSSYLVAEPRATGKSPTQIVEDDMSSTASNGSGPTAPRPVASRWRTPLVVILAGCLIAMVGFGIRSSFGLFLEPMTVTHGWDRSTFGLAMAIQTLLWGLGVSGGGMVAARRSEEHTSELQSLMRISYAVF